MRKRSRNPPRIKSNHKTVASGRLPVASEAVTGDRQLTTGNLINMPAERLQKIIAAAGIASRRKAEELITAGLVSVNGQTATELGTKADPEVDSIKVKGRLICAKEHPVYLLLNKPKGHVTTVTDPEGRPTVLDLVHGIKARVYPIGRLDYLSEGLLLLTNDGALAQKLTHASSHVPKTYLVKVSGKPSDDDVAKLRTGVFLPAERTPLKSPEAQ